MPDGSIPDPKMNPNEEKPFGIAYNYDDGHHYVYIKKDINGDPLQDSRYFAAGAQVVLGNIKQALLVVSKSDTFNPNIALDIDKAINDGGYEVVKMPWSKQKSVGGKESDKPKDPVIFEIIEVEKMKKIEDTNYQKVTKKLNAAAKHELNP